MWYVRQIDGPRRKLINRKTAEEALADAMNDADTKAEWEVLFPLDRTPTDLEYIDEDKKSIQYDLTAVRAHKWEEVKAKRDTLENGVAPTPMGLVQCDDRSKIKINGLIHLAFLSKTTGQAFAQNFTLANNEVAPPDADAMIAIGMAVGKYISDVFMVATALRDQIESMEDPNEILQLDIEGINWP